MLESPDAPFWHAIPYDEASDFLTAAFLDHARSLQSEKDFGEDGTGKGGYVGWLDRQLARLRSTRAKKPFGIYIIIWRTDKDALPRYAGACAIVNDDRNVAKAHGIPGDGFWAGTIGRSEALEAGLWLYSLQLRDELSQSFANDSQRPVRFNAITARPALALQQVEQFDVVDSGQDFDVPALGKVRLLYKNYTPQPKS